MDNQSALLPIDFRNTPQPWNLQLNSLTLLFCTLELIKLLECKNLAQCKMALYNFTYRAYILHWVIKLRWDSKHKIPNPMGGKNAFKPLGELYSEAVTLCMECHFLSPSGYENAAEWFCFILIDSALSHVYETSKEAVTRTLQAQNKQLRSLQNPFCPTEAPHTWLLIESAIALANRSDRFRLGAWRDFLAARSNWVKAYRSSEWIIIQATETGIFGQVGRGKNTRKINIKNPLFETSTL